VPWYTIDDEVAMPGQSLGPSQRLRTGAQFAHVRKNGRSIAAPVLTLGYVANGIATSRFGFLVSKRVGGAVVRNRVKRRLRESIRRRQLLVAPGWDVVVIARPAAARATFADLDQIIERLLWRARLDRPPQESAHARVAPGDEAPKVET
jgi:ribonuclease P protein component